MPPVYTIAPQGDGWSLFGRNFAGFEFHGPSRDAAVDVMFGSLGRLAPCIVEVRDAAGRLLESFDFLDAAAPADIGY